MNKCTVVFLTGMAIATASYAFFQQMMQMPQQAMTMGTMMLNPQTPCECKCPTNKIKKHAL